MAYLPPTQSHRTVLLEHPLAPSECKKNKTLVIVMHPPYAVYVHIHDVDEPYDAWEAVATKSS